MAVSSHKRRSKDLRNLLMSDYKVELVGDLGNEFYVDFYGPTNSLYEGGKWQVHVELPDDYPFKSPSIGFNNRIFHPNVDFRSGTICLDVINQTWSPMYDLKNIFDVFLPQLLNYPNPNDPLNSEAAEMLLTDPEKYNRRVKHFVESYASVAKVESQENSENRAEETDVKRVVDSQVSVQNVVTSQPNEILVQPVSVSMASNSNNMVGSLSASMPTMHFVHGYEKRNVHGSSGPCHVVIGGKVDEDVMEVDVQLVDFDLEI